MTDTNHLCDLWEHTIAKVFEHDSKSKLGLMLKQWIIFNKLENFNSILNYTIDDFTPSGNLSYMNQHGEILHHKPLREVFNLRCCLQHLMDESEDEHRINYIMRCNSWTIKSDFTYLHYIYQIPSSQALPTYHQYSIYKKLPTHKSRPYIA